MRIARALASAGIDSRRKCETHVRNGAVRVNGEVVYDLGRQINIDEDEVVFRGRVLRFERKVYFVLFKPVGFTTTAQDKHAKKTVFDILPKQLVAKTRHQSESRLRVFPVGRLDKDSSGLLLFTNDGDLANKLTHPRFGVSKWYEARLDRPLDPLDRQKILKGVRLREGMARVQQLLMLSRRVCRMQLKEGKNREIRRIFAKLEYEVIDLCRTDFGPISIAGLRPGDGYFLKDKQLKVIQEA